MNTDPNSPSATERSAAERAIRPGLIAAVLLIPTISMLLCIGWIAVAAHVQSVRRPSNVFLFGTGSAATVVPVILLLFGISAVMVLFLIGRISGARAAFDRYNLVTYPPDHPARKKGESFYAKIQKWVCIYTICCFPFSLIFGVMMLFNHTYFSFEGISIQNAPWMAPHQYSWSQIATVRTGCWHAGKGQSGPQANLRLIFDDGREISLPEDVMNWTWRKSYPQIAAALHGRTFKFEQIKVDRDCFSADLPTERP